MFYKPILLPLLVQVLITLAVWIYMYITRLREIRHKGIEPQQLALRSDAQKLLSASAAPADNFKNLFEMPLLFFLAVLLSLILLIQDDLLVAFAWGFVVLRAIHSLIHCTYNQVLHRFTVYIASSLMLFLMWFRLGLYILTQ